MILEPSLPTIHKKIQPIKLLFQVKLQYKKNQILLIITFAILCCDILHIEFFFSNITIVIRTIFLKEIYEDSDKLDINQGYLKIFSLFQDF